MLSHYVESHYVESHYTECHYSKCRGAYVNMGFSGVNVSWNFLKIEMELYLNKAADL